MGLFDGKTPSERNKMIAAAVLGVVSLFALYMAFGRSFLGGSTTTATTKGSPTPTPKAPSTASNANQFKLPTAEETQLDIIVPVNYRPGNTYGAPDPGRNIFAFYEPPPPTPFITPSPTPPPPPPVASPLPTPPFMITAITPQTIFAGSKGGFKLEVFGERFTPDSRIYFNQTEMPTQFVNSQSLTTTVSENMIVQEGPKQVIVQTPDGRAYSMAVSLNVMPPPRPSSLQYIGMIGRKRYNNDTAYFLETGKTTPFGARLNDVIASRFRLIDISAGEVVVEDVSLGFKHKIAMTTTASGSGSAPPGGGFIPYNPGGSQIQTPGNPNIQRGLPPQPPPRPDQRRPPASKDDVDDNDDPKQ